MTDPTCGLPEQIAKAHEHLQLALVCLDEAGEVLSPPYVQMAIDILMGWRDGEADAENQG